MAKFRNLTSAEIAEIFQSWNNFNLVFGQRFYIVRDITNEVYEVKIFDDNTIKTCIAHQTFSSLESLSRGLEYFCNKYC